MDRFGTWLMNLLHDLFPEDTAKANTDPRVMLRAASWDGGGKDVACLTCCDELTVHNIASVDEDGNARCKRCMS